MAVYEVGRNGRIFKGWSVRWREPCYHSYKLGSFWTKAAAEKFVAEMAEKTRLRSADAVAPQLGRPGDGFRA